MDYYTITTDAGDAALARYAVSGTQTVFAKIAVGDGGGASYEPSKNQAALRNEVWRGDAVVAVDVDDSAKVIVKTSIPAEVGNFTIREAGIFGSDGTLLAVAKMPLSEKTVPSSGSGTDLVVEIYVQVGNADAVSITVDPSRIQASKKDVADAKAEVEAEIPATLPASGGTAEKASYASGSVPTTSAGLRDTVILEHKTDTVPTGLADGTIVFWKDVASS